MDVIGEDGLIYEVQGAEEPEEFQVTGDVLGYDDNGEAIIVGAPRRRALRRAGTRGVAVVKKPAWRQTQMAPGVIAPDQGLWPLPLTGVPSDTFALATQAITFQGQVQKPFRGERLLVSTVRTGPTAVGIIRGQLFVGTDLNQLDTPPFDIEQLGAPNAFGVRMAMKPCQPGVFIRIVCTLSAAIAGADTIFCSVTILGRNIG